VVTGLGYVEGRRVAVFGPGFHPCWAARFPKAQALKVCRLMDAALGPAVCLLSALNDSGGARIQEGVWSLAGLRQSVLAPHPGFRGVIPQISVMLGAVRGRLGSFHRG